MFGCPQNVMQGSHPTGKTWKTGILSFTFPCLENAWNLIKKLGKIWNSRKNLKFANLVLRFTSFFSRCHLQKKNPDLHLCHIYIINKNTDSKPNWQWISLLLPYLPGNNLENTRNFVSPEKWEPWWWVLDYYFLTILIIKHLQINVYLYGARHLLQQSLQQGRSKLHSDRGGTPKRA